MTPPPKCCNPFQKKGHNSVKNKLYFLSEKHDEKFSDLFGSFVCVSCKRQLYQNKDSVQYQKINKPTKNQLEEDREKVNPQNEEDEEFEIESVFSKKDEKYVCKSVDNKIKRLKLAAAFQEVIMAPPAKKLNLNLSDADNEIIRKSFNSNSLNIFSDVDCNSWISDFKVALSRPSTREQKIFLLTTIPVKWSTRKTAKEFGVSRRMVASAKKLKDDKGYCAHPDKKKGRAMSLDLIDKVEEFYLSDDVSRVMPEVKDFKSVKINGKRQHETVSSS